jgi:hypothetical protein
VKENASSSASGPLGAIIAGAAVGAVLVAIIAALVVWLRRRKSSSSSSPSDDLVTLPHHHQSTMEYGELEIEIDSGKSSLVPSDYGDVTVSVSPAGQSQSATPGEYESMPNVDDEHLLRKTEYGEIPSENNYGGIAPLAQDGSGEYREASLPVAPGMEAAEYDDSLPIAQEYQSIRG